MPIWKVPKRHFSNEQDKITDISRLTKKRDFAKKWDACAHTSTHAYIYRYCFLTFGLPGKFRKLSKSTVLEKKQKIFCVRLFYPIRPYSNSSTHYCPARQLKTPSVPSLKRVPRYSVEIAIPPYFQKLQYTPLHFTCKALSNYS